MEIKKKHSFFRIKLFITLVAVTVAAFAFDARIRPMIQTYAVNQAANKVTQIINEAVFDELSDNKVTYNNLIDLTYGGSGNVTSLQTNMLELNRLQTGITKRIIARLIKFDSQSIKLSLGALIGGLVLSGRGPDIEIRLVPANFIRTKISNKFEDSGINQTRHQIIMEINLTVTAVMPGYRSSTTVDTNVVLAETIIVGQVPEAFTEVSDGTDPLVGMLQDYSAGSS